MGGSLGVLRAVIFDMDGVIVDSEPRHERAFLEVVNAIGFGGRHGLRFADFVGRSDQELWMAFVAQNKPSQSLAELLAMKRARVIEILRREAPLFDGLPQLVRSLAGRYRLALASGSEWAVVQEVLSLDGLKEFFQVVVSGSDIERGKPEPDIFLKAATLLNVAPAECGVIEDSKPGVAAGIAAGMKVIAITNTHPAEELQHATVVVSSYEQIGRLLLPLQGP
jgi:HAD superfamily hydrolase (TIGR01509 family)